MTVSKAETRFTVERMDELIDKIDALTAVGGQEVLDSIGNLKEMFAASHEVTMHKLATMLSDGGEFTKDIKDVDQVAFNDDYDKNLYACAAELEVLLTRKGYSKLADKVIFEHISDYDVRKGYSDEAYQALIRELTSKCHTNDFYEYQVIREKYGIGARIQDNPKGF